MCHVDVNVSCFRCCFADVCLCVTLATVSASCVLFVIVLQGFVRVCVCVMVRGAGVVVMQFSFLLLYTVFAGWLGSDFPLLVSLVCLAIVTLQLCGFFAHGSCCIFAVPATKGSECVICCCCGLLLSVQVVAVLWLGHAVAARLIFPSCFAAVGIRMMRIMLES